MISKFLAGVSCIFVLCAVKETFGAGAGRAFPVTSENYAVQKFQEVNPRLEWDPTNFLVDLSGLYANCKYVGTKGQVSVDRLTPDGATISGFVDDTYGDRADTDAVNGYIQTIIDNWMRNRVYHRELIRVNYIGCSVRPGCNGRVVVACLVSPSAYEPGNIGIEEGKQNGRAFTPEQYQLAERITGKKWDRSHYLENLSGFEIECGMITKSDWLYAHAKAEAAKRDLYITGLNGYAKNNGDTETAMKEVLATFKNIPFSKQVGCSVIPDCIEQRQMYVLVACLYEEQ